MAHHVWIRVVHLVAKLGRKHPPVALCANRSASDFLAFSERIHVCGIDEIHALLSRMGDDALRFCGIGLIAEHHRAKAQRRHAKIGFSETVKLHD